MKQERPLDLGLIFSLSLLVVYFVFEWWNSLSEIEKVFMGAITVSIITIGLSIWYQYFSKEGRERRKKIELIRSLPDNLINKTPDAVYMGADYELGVKLFLPDKIRSRHVHILGATGSGKTESVILNFIKQDIKRGLGAVILDAKGDASFLDELKRVTPDERLVVFDLSNPESLGYDPLASGSPVESAQRLFSSLNWSEEYYRSKAISALLAMYEYHYKLEGRNPTLLDLDHYLQSPEAYAATRISKSKKNAVDYKKEYPDILGLKDQVSSLSNGYLSKLLSPDSKQTINIEDARNGKVLYFRLQSLMSPNLVCIVGRLIINNLNYLAGTAHRKESQATDVKLIPTYLDEFASFACPEFADLISKARSAGLALHFSHQSIGDLTEVSKGFLNRITDNSATKIVMRINDPDSAEYMARTFGTKIIQKITQRVTNSEDIDLAKSVGEGSTREAHQYRASPDLLKTLPTGSGAVLIAHGQKTDYGASSVFKIQFPRLTSDQKESNS